MSVDVLNEKARLEKFYDDNLSALKSLGSAISNNILPMCLREFKYIEISFRVKEQKKAVQKIERKYTDNVFRGEKFEVFFPDLIGIRVVCLYEDEVRQIVDKIKDVFDCVEEHFSDKYMLNDEEPERFGYRAIHCVGRLGVERRRLGEYKEFPDVLFEIQVRTIIQDAWANLAHKVYHAPPPSAVRRKIAVVAAILELADREFLAIRDNA